MTPGVESSAVPRMKDQAGEVLVVRPYPASTGARRRDSYEVHLFQDGASSPDSVSVVEVPGAQGSLDVASAVERLLARDGVELTSPLKMVRGLYYRARIRR